MTTRTPINDTGYRCPENIQVERVSVASNGTEGNNDSASPAISASGRYVAYTSVASNLVPGDTNDTSDVFIYDRKTDTTERISVASDGIEGNARSAFPAISANGRYVAFQSTASNLVPGDTNDTSDVFVYDRKTDITERISVASDGTEGNAGIASQLAISANGRYVVYSSRASNLVPGDTNGTLDIFVYDRKTDTTERISVANDGTEGNGLSEAPTISANGRYVAFESTASNLVPDDTNDTADIFLFDRKSNTTERISVAADGTEGNGSFEPAISADGRFVAYLSFDSNIVPGDTNGASDVLVYDRKADTTERISVASDGTEGNAFSVRPSISANGRYVNFTSFASNLVPDDTNNTTDVFVFDRKTDTTERVSLAFDGTKGNAISFETAISASGRSIAYNSLASNLVPDDTNDRTDIFVVSTDYWLV